MEDDSITRIIRLSLAFMLNLLVAFIGVTILESPISAGLKLVTHSTASYVIREWTCSILLAGLLGASARRKWKTLTAAWVWLPGIAMLLAGLAGALGQVNNAWLTFSGMSCVQHGHGLPCIQFWSFTVPFVRTISYSMAAALAARQSGEAPEFHPILSRMLTAMFAMGLPKGRELDSDR